jgi:hypothetical protein
VDVIKQENGLEGWTTGTVLERVNGLFRIALDEINDGTEALLYIPGDIAPFGVYTDKNEWRFKLAKGDLVDCLDTTGCWYLSTILDIKASQPPKVLIGYRTYKEDGKKKDDEGRMYQGWSKNFDEWIDSFSLRIQPANSLSKQGYLECKVGDKEYDKNSIDDSADILLNSPQGVEVFCVHRQDKESSDFVVKLLNEFGARKGFDQILQRLTTKDKPLPFGMIIEEIGRVVFQLP